MRFFTNAVAVILFSAITFIHPSLYAGTTSPPQPTKKDKCPVCGMFVSGYQNWIVSITHKDGTVAFFDGAKDMFTYYLHPEKFSKTVKKPDAALILVKDYYSLKSFDARTAFFVIGSDVTGPMGKELIPLAGKSDAQEFLKDHKGTKILRFNEITEATIKSLQ